MENGYKKIPIGKVDDLSGKRFGHWTVLFRTNNDATNKAVWICQCDCVNKTIKPVSARTLKNGTSTNCGCERLNTITKKSDEKIHKRDENGNIILKRCSRCHKWLPLTDYWKNSCCKDGYCGECKDCQNIAKENRFNIYKKNAKRRGLSFQLSKEQFYTLTAQPCEYCGRINEYNGIDRIDSNKDYTIDNCVPCCASCNIMKNDTPFNEWINNMKLIIKHLEEKQ